MNNLLILFVMALIGSLATILTSDSTDYKIKAAFKHFGVNIPIFTSKGIE